MTEEKKQKIEKLLIEHSDKCLGEMKPRTSVDFLISEINKILDGDAE